MGKYNFDEIIDRKNTGSLKHDFAKKRHRPEDIMPFWVADMDFKTAPEVIEALLKRSQHGIFGYTEGEEAFFQSIQSWFKKRYDYNIEEKWIVSTPGVVYAICAAIRAFTQKGDSILIQRPIYYPFFQSIIQNGRKLINNPLVYRNSSYEIDFEDFEEKIVQNNVALFLLCNPHNPVGRVWTKEELTRMGEICLKHHVLIISDEIHADFIHKDHKHLVMANMNEEISASTITCTSPSKTFNLAGLQISNIIISNRSLKREFINELNRSGYSQPNTMGIVAAQAAYSYGEEWLNELTEYIQNNIENSISFIHSNLPKVKVIKPEGTYLLWLDFNEYGLSTSELDDLIINEAKLWFDSGIMFGEEGAGFQRINVACPWSYLEEGLTKLHLALEHHFQ